MAIASVSEGGSNNCIQRPALGAAADAGRQGDQSNASAAAPSGMQVQRANQLFRWLAGDQRQFRATVRTGLNPASRMTRVCEADFMPTGRATYVMWRQRPLKETLVETFVLPL